MRIKIDISTCVLMLSLFLYTCSYANTWYVKPDSTGDAPTIQAAIDSSASGDTVLVSLGIYQQPLILIDVENDSLTILSEGGDKGTILNVIGPGPIMIIQSSEIVVKGFTFSNSPSNGVSINLGWSIIIEENTFYNNQLDAILINNSGDIIIKNNLIYSNQNGIHTADCASYLTISNNTIAYNIGETWGIGLLLDPCGSYEMLNNIITQNDIGVYSWCSDLYFSCNDAIENGINYDLVYFSDPTGTNGNISNIVQFCGVDPVESSNFYLQSDSPCAPGNHPGGYPCGVIGRFPVHCEATAVKEQSWGGIKSKYK